MKTKRALVDSIGFDSVASGAAIPKEVEHYFTQVLRMGSGQLVEIGDGSGRVLRGCLAATSGGFHIAAPEVQLAALSSDPTITLFAALLKQKRWQLLVEKAVELGANRLVPVITERTTVRPAPDRAAKARERWEKIAREAGKQCRRPTLCQIELPISFSSAVSDCDSGSRLLLSLASSPPVDSILRRTSDEKHFAIMIGPEGGLSPSEETSAIDQGFQPASLGSYPLRAETAAIVMLGLIRART